MIILVVHVRDIRPDESKRDPPVAAYLDSPRPSAISLERVETEARKSHVPRGRRYAEPPENQPQSCGMTALYPRGGTSSEETLQAFVPEPDDRHSVV